MVTVRITNDYSDGHHSEHEVRVNPPAGDLEEWWEDEVWPHTGDGHNTDDDLGYCHTATVVAVDSGDDPGLVGMETEWAGK